jgi:hypothetical protein
MPSTSRAGSLRDIISPGQLASYGRYQFLGPVHSGVLPAVAIWLVSDMAAALRAGGPGTRAEVIAELERHAGRGEWEKVGAWKFASQYLCDDPDAVGLRGGGWLP